MSSLSDEDDENYELGTLEKSISGVKITTLVTLTNMNTNSEQVVNILSVDNSANLSENDDRFESSQSCQSELTDKNDLHDKISKMPCLDGKFFTVDFESSSLTGALFAKCNLCPSKKQIKGSIRVTSNFTSHLKRVHPDDYQDYLDYCKLKREIKQDTIIDRKRWSCTFNQTQFENNVTNLVLKLMLPFSIVEDSVFRKIFDDFHFEKGNFKMTHLTRYTLGKKVDESYDETMEEIKKHIKSIVEKHAYVCTTADVWTAGARRYLGVTISWIDIDSLERKSAAIACRRFPGTHSFDAIGNLLSSIHLSFGLSPEKIKATVTDNGSNFVKAFKVLGIDVPFEIPLENLPEEIETETQIEDTINTSSIEENSDELEIPEPNSDFGKSCKKILPTHCRCATHTLNLTASTDVSKAIASDEGLKRKHQSVMNKCSSLWKLLRSAKKREMLKQELGVAINRPVVTRWNSTYDCLSQLVKLENKLIGNSFRNEIKPLQQADFNYLREFLICSKPLATAIDVLQGDKCYYGILLPQLVSVVNQMTELMNNEDIVYCKPIVQCTIDGINNRFEKLFNFFETNIDAAIAAISHPQFKGRWLSKFSEEEQREVHERFLTAVSSEVETETSETQEKEEGMDIDDEYQFGPDLTIDEFRPTSSQGEVRAEVTRFLKCKEKNLNMLNKFPLVKKTFLKYNVILPSSAAVERLFSHATLMNLPKFNRVTDENFEKRVLLKANSSKKYL